MGNSKKIADEEKPSIWRRWVSSRPPLPPLRDRAAAAGSRSPPPSPTATASSSLSPSPATATATGSRSLPPPPATASRSLPPSPTATASRSPPSPTATASRSPPSPATATATGSRSLPPPPATATGSRPLPPPGSSGAGGALEQSGRPISHSVRTPRTSGSPAAATRSGSPITSGSGGSVVGNSTMGSDEQNAESVLAARWDTRTESSKRDGNRPVTVGQYNAESEGFNKNGWKSPRPCIRSWTSRVPPRLQEPYTALLRRNSIAVTPPRPHRPKRFTEINGIIYMNNGEIIDRSSIMREWCEDEDESFRCQNSEISKVPSESKKLGLKHKCSKKAIPAAKQEASSSRLASDELVAVLIANAADLDRYDPVTTRVMLPAETSSEDLSFLLKQAISRGFRHFVNGNPLARAALHRFCAVIDAEAKSKTTRRNNKER